MIDWPTTYISASENHACWADPTKLVLCPHQTPFTPGGRSNSFKKASSSSWLIWWSSKATSWSVSSSQIPNKWHYWKENTRISSWVRLVITIMPLLRLYLFGGWITMCFRGLSQCCQKSRIIHTTTPNKFNSRRSWNSQTSLNKPNKQQTADTISKNRSQRSNPTPRPDFSGNRNLPSHNNSRRGGKE